MVTGTLHRTTIAISARDVGLKKSINAPNVIIPFGEKVTMPPLSDITSRRIAIIAVRPFRGQNKPFRLRRTSRSWS